jgi:pimeloyl-ACP methyl ester carboxylesterase
MEVSDMTQNEKPLALLIPGLDGTGQLFYRHLNGLALKYRVRPWVYESQGNFGLADLTRELGNATAGEDPGSILVVAESFGGLVALSYVLDYPERVKQLVLVNSFPYYRRRFRLSLARALTPLLQLRGIHLAKNFIIDRTLRSEGVPIEARRHFQQAIRQIHLEAYRQRLRVIQQTDLRLRLGAIAVPTLIFASGRDKLVPSIAEAAFMSERIPHAQVHQFRDAGHALLLTPGISLADYV